MLYLIPNVKKLETLEELFDKKPLKAESPLTPRLEKALQKLPLAADGIPFRLTVNGTEGEGYTVDLNNGAVSVTAESEAAAFYAIQTLRQIYGQKDVPCLKIEDRPDFAYRGFYHDVTRGRIATVDTLKQLIDRLASLKINSLQLYVEHVFEFKETADLQPHTGFLTGAELEELDAYCKENFIEFIPSLATFGHMYEILQQPKYHHLRVLSDYPEHPNFWNARMAHHTVDPLQEESFELVKSLIDQFIPHFTTDTFNLCGDETFDLTKHARQDLDRGQMYVEFVQKIIAHLKSRGKKVMMWADILLKHPETIGELPEDTCFLNWNYRQDPPETQVAALEPFGRPQIVCPGTSTWSRLCEDVSISEGNIGKFAEYGYQHGAIGVLNTNWGDWGNPCSIELALFGLAWGAEKSWSVATPAGEGFYAAADELIYGKEGRVADLKTIATLQPALPWNAFAQAYFNLRHFNERSMKADEAALRNVKTVVTELLAKWTAEEGEDPIREELICMGKGALCMADLIAALAEIPMERTADVKGWLAEYSALWRRKNKESELRNIVEMFTWLDENL